MDYRKLLSHCTLCPRKCGADRLHGQVGFCKATDQVKVARAALHQWEEPCISGDRGSGTVFFSYCTLQCIFCQNYEISTCHQGKEITVARLSELFLDLQAQGAHNINLVTPTHYLPQIIEALTLARKQGLTLPIVYNSSGYETPETIRLLDGFIDIYLPDFKYMDDSLARQYSHAPDYAHYAKESIPEMVRQVGEPQFDEDGILQKGVVIRHLMLPEQLEDSKEVIRWVYETFGDQVYLSLMNQYTPLKQVEHLSALNHKLDPIDYDEAIDFALSLGLTQGFIQEEETASESFIPDFSGEGL